MSAAGGRSEASTARSATPPPMPKAAVVKEVAKLTASSAVKTSHPVSGGRIMAFSGRVRVHG